MELTIKTKNHNIDTSFIDYINLTVIDENTVELEIEKELSGNDEQKLNTQDNVISYGYSQTRKEKIQKILIGVVFNRPFEKQNEKIRLQMKDIIEYTTGMIQAHFSISNKNTDDIVLTNIETSFLAMELLKKYDMVAPFEFSIDDFYYM